MRVLLLIFFFTVSASQSVAQCAMCRSTLENNFSNGSPGIAAGINTGILYLLVMPYLAVLILGYFWYKSSKNARKELHRRVASR
ncbi:MAG: hypothetical protein ACOYXT_04915 [Bacteroidota bacterium]